MNSPQAVGWTWCFTIVVLLGIGLWMASFGPQASADDFAQYLMHTQALLAGRQYGDIGYLFTHYSWGTGPPIAAPGLPLTLLPVLATIGFQDWMHAAIMLSGVLACAYLTARYFARESPELGAAAAFLVTAALVLSGATRTLAPDLIFLPAIWAVAYLADRNERWGWGATLAIAFFGVWAILYRTAGVPLIPAMVVFWVLSFRSLRWKPLVPIAAWTLTFWYVYFVMGAGRFPDAPPGFVFDPGSGSGTMVGRMLKNIGRYRWPLFDLQLYPTPWKIFNAGYHVLLTAIMAYGLIVWMRGNWRRFGTIFCGGYLAMLIIAPVQTSRYLWPLFPLAAFGLVRGLNGALSWGRLALISTATRVMVPLLLATVCATLTVLGAPPQPTILRNESVVAVFDFLNGALTRDPGTRVVFFKPRTVAWETGVPAMPLFNPPGRQEALRELRDKQIDYVVVGTLGVQDASAEAFWRRFTASRPDLFSQVLKDGELEVFRLTEVR